MPSATRVRPRRRVGAGRVVVVLLSVLVFLAVSCSDGGEDDAAGPTGTAASSGTAPDGSEAASGGVLRLAVVGADSLDPAEVVPTSQSGMIAADLLFDGLAAIDPETQAAVPALAEGWTSNPELTAWTFSLRDGVAFADGTALTATDVKYSLERIARQGSGSLAGSRLEVLVGYQALLDGATDLSGIRVVDDRTVELTTLSPYAGLPELLASPVYGVVPRAAVEASTGDFAQSPVGSGPFRVAGREANVVRLERAPGSTAKADGVELVRFDSLDAAYQAFVDGQVDWTLVPSARKDEAVAAYGDAHVTALQATLFFGFNLTNPSFADTRFRQAMVQAVDRERLALESVKGYEAMSGVVPSSVAGAAGFPCGDPSACAHDPDRARALVSEVFPNGNVPTVEIDYYDDPVQQQLAEAVQADLNAVGIPTQLIPKSFEEYRTFVVTGNQQLFSFGWVGLAPDAEAFLGPLFASGGLDNVTGFSDAAVDQALQAARATADRQERVEAYAEIERQVMAQFPILPVVGFATNAVASDDVEDLTGRLDGTFDAEQVWVQRGESESQSGE